ncbi:MAG: hypothetical protein HDQ98_05070 [Lachnospiraceae bacterium]|nr:hypothetical protein [Lachnospiraceae bacterium]
MNWKSRLQSHKLYTALVCVTVLTSILMLISFEYIDVDSITAWSLNFWDLLFRGRLDEFYQYAAENLRGADYPNCSGNYLWLLPVCIWNFPLWVVHRICGIMSVHYFFSLCWTKLFWLFAQIVTALTCRKICLMLMGNGNRGVAENTGILAFLLVMASPEIMLSTGYAGQDEIIYICLFMLAFYEYLCEKWRKCYLLMIGCVSLCPIMLLPCIALFLLKEKNIVKLLGLTVGTMVPTVLFEFLYRNDAIYQVVKQRHDFGSLIIDFFSEYRIMPETNELSYSLIALLILYFVCYTTKKRGEEDQRKTVFMMALAFFIICYLMEQDFYRMFLWVPFFVVLVLTSKQNRNMNLFLLSVLTFGRAVYMCQAGWTYKYVLNTKYVMPWLKGLCGRENDTCMWDYLCNFFEGDYWVILRLTLLAVPNIIMASTILLLVINRPNFKNQYDIAIPAKVSVILYTCCMPLLMLAFCFMLF